MAYLWLGYINVWKLLQLSVSKNLGPKIQSRNMAYPEFFKGDYYLGFECSIRLLWASTDFFIRVFRLYEKFQSVLSFFGIVSKCFPVPIHPTCICASMLPHRFINHKWSNL